MTAGIALAQSPATRPAFDSFEVATIRPTPPDWSRGRFIRMESAQHFVARNHALNTLIAAAYNLSPQAIYGGPKWVVSDHYDILAETPGNVRPNPDEQMSMLRSLLADRFRLTFHREQKELPVYVLSVAKGGPKLKESTVSPDASPEGPPMLAFVLSPRLVRLPARYTTMADFASILQRSPLDRPVLDQTGLSGVYDFDLEFAPNESLWGGILPRPADSDKPGLFAALREQLGLRIEATRGPVETLVIDRVDRPSEN
jgi:uncharacterized protein (TIGR03435 family)